MKQNRRNAILAALVFAGAFFAADMALAADAAPQPQPPQKEVQVLTISQGIAMVLHDSRLIRVALPGKDMAFQDSMMARSALLPHFQAAASQTFNRYASAVKFGSTTAGTADKNYYSYGFDVYQTLFDFGKSLSQYQASKELVKASDAHIDSIKRLAILEFIVAYFDLLEAEKMIVVAEKEVESLASYLNDVEHLYEHGSAVKNDLLPAQVRLADAKQKLIAARSAREIAAARLNDILALPLRQKVVVRDMEMKPPEIPEMEEAWSIAVKERPEVVFYEDQIRASALSVRSKAAENLPTIYADGGYAYTKNQYEVHQDNAYIALGAKVNLYDGGNAQADMFKERARQRQLREEKNKVTEDIKFEIEDSYLTLKDAREKVVVARDVLSQAAENVRFYRAKYAAGAANTTEVLEAITLETKAQTNYFESDYEVKRSYAKLMYSMGIDLTLLYETMEKTHEHVK
ncbi:alkaline protease secretion protein AprF [Candidatus Velamenicoccus archaeovorus]|uniref:Alkaline protease secretion protein AprF n=1 Tax=Velamenicoccus archaeovorus TaxID=1930593 RepID=A0A410P367_VELA1|nr:TolC family protein [Candidatus Velamenicoccus archaeovorus]QAT16542.1 alkaline protease secretion protein AprF [Candidatus Velamenicoccus archaeovorus]